jgi:hypothetical protein
VGACLEHLRVGHRDLMTMVTSVCRWCHVRMAPLDHDTFIDDCHGLGGQDDAIVATLTLYRLTAYDADGAIVFVEAQALGQDDADKMAADLMAIPDVLSVRCEAVGWGSVKERDTINGAMFTGLDLLTPITHAARRAGVDFDPEHVNPADLLDRLRAIARAHSEEEDNDAL